MCKPCIASVIMPTKNRWESAWRCIHNLSRYTEERYEIILVDNASDFIPDYILKRDDLYFIRNGWDRGEVAAINQGMKKASGEYIVWLKQRAVPSHRWLTQMIRVLKETPAAGMVGPMTNRGLEEQRLPVPFQALSKIHRFSNQYNHSDPRHWKEVSRLQSFCCVLPRAVVEEVGELDEWFGMGSHEVDDYGVRLKQAGYRLVVAGDTYVHQFRDTEKNKGDLRERKKRESQNRRYFIHKWGSDVFEAADARK
ncbi:glycosyltransferase family 2 protein [Laceyella sacchari]|nr:glycosyltransferase [Laceyella sacchari]TCW41673.1 GT2 family glycosyltransferase [Laceyella sacchari]